MFGPLFKKRLKILGLSVGSLALGFLLVSLAIIPMVDKWRLEQMKGPVLEPLGDEEPEAYNYWYAPQNSFGISETKEVNWSHFKQLFNSHTDWMLEYKRYASSPWTDGKQYLSINKSWNESGFWKINLILDVPVDVYSVRFTFGCNLSVLDYVERDGTEVWLNFSANSTENYSVMFNWSDIASIPGLVFTKGVLENNTFWFRIRKDSVSAGHYEFDPTFGETRTSGGAAGSDFEDFVRGYNATFTGTTGCIINSMTARVRTGTTSFHYTYGIYYASNWTLLGQTAEVSSTKTGVGYASLTANFNAPKPTLTNGVKYSLCAWANDSTTDYAYIYQFATGGFSQGQALSYTGTYPNPYVPTTFSTYNYTIYCTYSNPPWSNTAPTISCASPANNSVNQDLGPTLSVCVNDTDGNTTTVNWYENSTGTWLLRQTNNTVTANTTVYCVSSGFFNTASTSYWWNVTVADDYANVSDTFKFTTEANESPQQSFKPTLWFNTSFSNTSSFKPVLWYNSSFGNSSFVWRPALWFNTSFGNTSNYKPVLWYNSSFGNASFVWKPALWFNTSFGNATSFVPSLWFNTSFGNGTFKWSPVLYFNTSFSNTTGIRSALWYNTSFSNSSFNWNASLWFNTSFSNTSSIKPCLWFNTSFSNTTRIGYLWFNSSFGNSSFDIIILSSPYPVNNSDHVIMDVILNITVAHTNGTSMNLTWYYGNSSSNLSVYLGSTLNVTNGTYHMHLANASIRNSSFYWSVNATDGDENYNNGTYNFTTSIKGGIPWGRDHFIIGLSVGIMFSFVFTIVLFWRKKEDEPE